jgi:hypothetical protein
LGALTPQAKVIARMSGKPKRLKLRAEHSPDVLRHNLGVMGITPGNATDRAHHIVAGAKRAAPAKAILARYSININSPRNVAYYDVVNRRLQAAATANGKKGVVAELRAIAQEVEVGVLRVHN